MSSRESTERFSDRVADYNAARPGYPVEIIDNLRSASALCDGAIVADIGSGTGISSALFLNAGCRVFGVEPNDAMRRAADQRLGANARFTSINGAAEATTLAPASVDLVAAGQAFHWFKPDATAEEFKRILRPSGWITVFWNTRDHQATPFMRELEALIVRFGTDFAQVTHEQLPESALQSIFRRDRKTFAMRNTQVLAREGLHARLLSASYLPSRGTPQAAAMLAEADALFGLFAQEGVVKLEYRTDQYIGRL